MGVRLRALSAVVPAGNATDLLMLGGTAAAVVRSNKACIITDYYFLQTGLNYSVANAPAPAGDGVVEMCVLFQTRHTRNAAHSDMASKNARPSSGSVRIDRSDLSRTT